MKKSMGPERYVFILQEVNLVDFSKLSDDFKKVTKEQTKTLHAQ